MIYVFCILIGTVVGVIGMAILASGGQADARREYMYCMEQLREENEELHITINNLHADMHRGKGTGSNN